MQENKKKVVVWRKKLNTHTHTYSTEGGESSSWSEVDLRASSELDRRSCMARFFFFLTWTRGARKLLLVVIRQKALPSPGLPVATETR